LVTWIDANAPYHDGFINTRANPPPYDVAADHELLGQLTAIHARRCAGCHQVSEVTRIDWIDIHEAKRSRFLAAPLSAQAGGSAKCSQAVYRDPSDPDYQAVLKTIEAAVEKLWANPRRDVLGCRDKTAKP